MDLAELIYYCLSKKGAGESAPFVPEVLVYKVGAKVFAITGPDDYPSRINLKCDPDRAILLRDEYDAVTPGYHMNKKHWNTVVLDGSIPSDLLRELVDHSYDLVIKGMTQKERDSLN